VLARVDLDRFCFVGMLGGPGRTTLFLLTAQWRGAEKVDEAIAARTGKILVMQAPVAGTGWP
jgi:sugar lactone lactonase YvrE